MVRGVGERVGGNKEKERDGGGEGTPAIRALNGSIVRALGPAKFRLVNHTIG